MPHMQGIQLLALLGELTETPEGIAKYLRNARGLDKTQIGEYISKKYV